MAEVITKNGVSGLSFGLDADEGDLITHKVSCSRKIKKKDLRGNQGGYRAIASYSKTSEVTIEGALTGGGTTGFTLAMPHTLATNPFPIGGTLYVESISISQKNEDFQRATIKLVGNDNL